MMDVPIRDLILSPMNPRIPDDAAIQASGLLDSVRQYGVMQPPTARAVVRRDVDPRSVAEREQFRDGHVLEAQRRMVEENPPPKMVLVK
jgi:ParB-like chromosome segregation protein Spo0J